jgi:hypothetical protein
MLREEEDRAGRSEPLDVNLVPFGSRMNSQEAIDYHAFREQLAELESVGVSWVTVGVPGTSRVAYIDSLARFADEVIA